MRYMYDSITPSAIPSDAIMVAGYVNGQYSTWSQADWNLFPNAVKVKISTTADPTAVGVYDAQVLDTETYDATPAQAVEWATAKRARGEIPTIYCNASTWPTVQQLFNNANEPQPEYWIAAYPGSGPTIPNGAIAHQYLGSPGNSPGNYDVSVVADFWPGVDQPPTPQPNEEDMRIIYTDSKGFGALVAANKGYRDLSSEEFNILKNLASTKVEKLSDADHAVLRKIGPGL